MKTIRDALRKNGLGQVDVETIENVQGRRTSFSDKDSNFCLVTALAFLVTHQEIFVEYERNPKG